MKPTESQTRELIRRRLDGLDEATLISIFNTIGLILGDPKYFDEINAKYYKKYNDDIRRRIKS